MKNLPSNFARWIPALLVGFIVSVFCKVEGAIVTNGDFETNAALNGAVWEAPLTGWGISEVTSGVNQAEVRGLDTNPQYGLSPHSPHIAAAFFSATGATGSGASLTQTLTTDPSKFYNLSLWVANPIADTGNLNNVFSISWNGALITLSGSNLTAAGGNQYKVNGDPANWYQILATGLPVTETSTNLVISARNNGWGTLVDDVLVQEVPEPSTMAMLGIGAALMGFRRRRRQNS